MKFMQERRTSGFFARIFQVCACFTASRSIICSMHELDFYLVYCSSFVCFDQYFKTEFMKDYRRF